MLYDILFSAILALVLTWIIITFSRVFRLIVSRSTELFFNPEDLDTVMQRCYNLFPIDSLFFKGATFTRSMTVRVVTDRKKTIVGRFVGTNERDMVCVVTDEAVVVQTIGSIEEITVL